MKYVWRIAFLALILIPVAQVHAEVTTVKKDTSDLRAFDNLESRLENLESYSVVYVESGGTKQEVLKSAPARQEVLKSAPARHSKSDELRVELRKVNGKRKS